MGPWDECPGIFLPQKILEMCFRVRQTPSQEEMSSIAFLAWVSPEEVATYYSMMVKKLEEQKDEDIKREAWKKHSLYRESKETLGTMCRDAGLFVYGKKHELVQRIVKHKSNKDDEVASLQETDLYDGNIESIPNSSAGLIKLSAAQLRAILRKHHVLEVGTKEELIMRVGLLKGGYPEAAFSRERLCLLHIIETAMKIWKTQEELSMKSIHRKRKFAVGQENTSTTRTSCLRETLKPRLPLLQQKNQQRGVEKALAIFKAILTEEEEKLRRKVGELEKNCNVKSNREKRKIQAKIETPSGNVNRRPERIKRRPVKFLEQGEVEERENFLTGKQVEVLWTEKDLEGTNWEPGWYKGEVQRFDEESDELYIFYFKDRSVYRLDATSAIVDRIIRPI